MSAFKKCCQLLILLILFLSSIKDVSADWNTDLIPPSASISGYCEGGQLKETGSSASGGVTTYTYDCPGTYANLGLYCSDNRGCLSLIYNTGAGNTTVSFSNKKMSEFYVLSSPVTNSPNPRTVSLTSVDTAGNQTTTQHIINFVSVGLPTVDLRVDTQVKTFSNPTTNDPAFLSLPTTVTISSSSQAYLYWRSTNLGPGDTCIGDWITSLTKTVGINDNAKPVGPYSASKTLTITCSQNSTGRPPVSDSVTVNILGSSPVPTPSPTPVPLYGNCPGTCASSAGPASQYPDPWNGTCLNATIGQRGWWDWDDQPANSSCTDSVNAHCYTCAVVQPTPTPAPPSGIQYPTKVSQAFSGPLLWGKIYKDILGSGLFSAGNPTLDSSEGSSAQPNITAPGGPSGPYTGYSPNLLRGRMVYYAAYSGTQPSGTPVNPAYITRNFGYTSLPATATLLPDSGGTTYPADHGVYGTTHSITETPVPGFLGIMYVNDSKTWCNWNGFCTGYGGYTNFRTYKITNKTGSCSNGCTLQPIPIYNPFFQSPSRPHTENHNGNYTTYTMSGPCPQGYSCNLYASCVYGGTAPGTYSSCPTNCSLSCDGNTKICSESCSTTYYEAPGPGPYNSWELFEEKYEYGDTNAIVDRPEVRGFKKTGGVNQAQVTYSGLKISNPKTNYITDLTHSSGTAQPDQSTGTGALFDDWWTNNPGPTNPECRCENWNGVSDCSLYGWRCEDLPVVNENRMLPTGKYLFKIPSSSSQLSLNVKVNGIQQSSNAGTLDGSANMNFYFDLSGTEGDSVDLELQTTFGDPNNLPAVTLGAAGLYALGVYEVNITTVPATAFTNWCSYPLTVNNKPSLYPIHQATQTTDNYQCTGIAGSALSNQSTSVDTYKLIQADILLGRLPNTITGKIFFDRNQNGLKDAGATEPYISVEGVATVAGAPGYLITREDLFSYSVRNLKAGNYSINFSPNLPYNLSLPAGMSGYNVTVGPGCSVPNASGTSIGQCDANGNITGLDFGVTQLTCAWIQTIGGDVHSNTIINTPCGP